MVYAFAYRLLLDRYTAGEGVAFATPVSRRSHPATAEMIGYFLNPLVLAGSVDEDLEVERALSEFSQDLREVLTRASVPFLTLAEEVAPQQRSDRHPIFQTMFVYQQSPATVILGDASLEPVTLDLAESKFDLTLFVGESEESLEIAVEYRSDRYAEIHSKQGK